MKTSRRQFVTAAAVAGTSSLALPWQAQAQNRSSMSQAISRKEFERYISLFNNNQPSFVDFYDDNVVLELSNQPIEGKQGILDFYAEVKQHLIETVTIEHFVSDPTGLAVVLPTEFKCFKDWDSAFFRRSIKKGEVMRLVSFVIYWVQDKKFTKIKSARYKLINDWQKE